RQSREGVERTDRPRVEPQRATELELGVAGPAGLGFQVREGEVHLGPGGVIQNRLPPLVERSRQEPPAASAVALEEEDPGSEVARLGPQRKEATGFPGTGLGEVEARLVHRPRAD